MKKLIELILELLGLNKKDRKTPPEDSIGKLAKDNEKENIIEKQERRRKAKIGDIKFKHAGRLRSEFSQLKKNNRDLYDIIVELNKFTNERFAKPVTITMIYRTQAEQDYLYRNNKRYQKKKFKSPHQFWHAIDIRSRVFSDEEIEIIEDEVNKYNASNYYKWTAKCHTVGHGRHFHIQYIEN